MYGRIVYSKNASFVILASNQDLNP